MASGMMVTVNDSRIVRTGENLKTGRVTCALITREAFRKERGLTNAEAKRQYRECLTKFNQGAAATFSALTTDGVHHCTRIGKSLAGSYTFSVRAVKPDAAVVAKVSARSAELTAENVELTAKLAELQATVSAMQARVGA